MRSFVVKLAEEFENELHISSEEAKAKASHVVRQSADEDDESNLSHRRGRRSIC